MGYRRNAYHKMREVKTEETPKHQGKKLTHRRKAQLVRWAPFSKFEPCVVTVNCMNKEEHKIELTEDGNLILHNHSRADLNAILAMKSLGARNRCRCLTVLKQWRLCSRRSRSGATSLPEPLRSESVRAGMRNRRRFERNNSDVNRYEDPLKKPLLGRPSVMGRLVNRAFETLAPHLSKDPRAQRVRARLNIEYGTERNRQWASGDVVLKLPPCEWPANSEVSAPQYLHSATSIPIRVGEEWYRTIYKRGLAIVDGFFVSDIQWDQSANQNQGQRVSRSYRNLYGHQTPLKSNQYHCTLLLVGSDGRTHKSVTAARVISLWQGVIEIAPGGAAKIIKVG